MLGGQIMVEAVFSYPGVGKLIVDAILGLDYPVVIGFFYIIITLGIIMSIVTDFVYVIIDPRVRYG
jgi:peptide/nickel transport system permease protein